MAVDPDLRLARKALRQVGVAASLRRVATGLDSTYRADSADGRRFAVRIAGPFPFRRPAATAMEATWIRALGHEADLVVPEVIAPTNADPLIVEDAEGRARGVLILSWLPGRKMRWRFAAHHAHAVGAAAAVLHRNAQSFVPPTQAWAKTWSPASLIGSGDRQIVERLAGKQASTIIDRVHSRLAAASGELGSEDWTLVNGDLGPHNVVWNNHSPGLFDFNDLGWGYTGFDLGRYLHGLRWRARGELLVEAALDGYQSVAPLPDSFQRYGHLFEAAAGLFLAHYLAGQIDERGDDAIRTIRGAISRADNLSGLVTRQTSVEG